MRKYLVSLEIITKDYSLHELEMLLNFNADSSSHSIGDIRGLGRGGLTFDSTILKLHSRITKTADIAEHLSNIHSLISENKVLDMKKIPANCSVLLNIGLLFDSFTCSFTIPPDHWRWMGENNISMDITYYPCSDDSDEDDSDD